MIMNYSQLLYQHTFDLLSKMSQGNNSNIHRLPDGALKSVCLDEVCEKFGIPQNVTGFPLGDPSTSLHTILTRCVALGFRCRCCGGESKLSGPALEEPGYFSAQE